MPVARRNVVDRLEDGIIVLDLQDRIVDLNPAMQEMVGKPARAMIGQPVGRLLGSLGELINQSDGGRTLETEIKISIADVDQDFELRVSPLHGQREAVIGWLVVLHDITDRKLAENEIRRARDGLDLMVTKRTAELEEANRKLREELVKRQSAEERYQTLFEEAPVMYVITRNQDGTAIIVDCNRLFLETLGYQREEVLGHPLADFYSPNSRTALEHSYLRSGEEELLLEERQLLTTQGKVIETLLQTISELDPEGNALGTRSMYLDITQRKLAEAALRESEQTFRALFENANDAIFRISLDGLHLHVNQKAAKMLGYAEDELVGMTIYDIIDPQETDDAENRLKSLLAGQTLPSYERSFRTKDGDLLPVEINLSLVLDDEGDPKYILSIVRDISQRKIAEKALRESEAKFRSIFESSPLGKHQYQLAADGRLIFTEANPAADDILGVDHKLLVGSSIEEAFPGIDTTELPEKFRRVAERGGIWKTDQLHYESDDISGTFEVHGFQTSPGRMVAAFSDITERKQAEQTIQRLAKQRQRLLQVSRSMLATLALDEVMDQILLTLQDLLSYDLCSIYLLDKEAGLLRPSKIAGLEYISETLGEWPIQLGQGIAGAVAQSGQGEMVNDAHLDPRSLYPDGAEVEREHLISIPVRVQEEIIGVFNVGRIQAVPFTEEEFELRAAVYSPGRHRNPQRAALQ